MSIIVGYDPTTLRERVDLQAVGVRLDEIGVQRSSSALNEKVDLLRLAGRLDEAWEAANEALRQARFSSDREELCHTRIRRARVQLYQGKLDAAVIELTSCITEAHASEWAAVEAMALIERGRAYFEQGELTPALIDFRAAVTLRVRIGATASEVDSAMTLLAIAESFAEPQ